MAMRESVRLLTAAALALTGLTSDARAQSAPDCQMAGKTVRVLVEEQRDAALHRFTYVVINDRRERLREVRIGSGGVWDTEIVPRQRPLIVATPDQWRGAVVYPTDTDQFYVAWEATDVAHALAPKSRRSFAIEAAPEVRPRPAGVQGQRVKSIDFQYRPFTVYGESGCWWGWTSAAGVGTPVGGYLASTVGASVRSFAQTGREYVIVDAPALDAQMRLSDKQIFVTMPITLSWGVKGGFSHNASIGIGLRWSPIEYVSVYAQTHIGTFLFTNRTHLRHVGFDINVPRYTTSTMGTISRDKYLVFGVEYFDRSAVRWAGYMDGPQWYASGRGIAIRFGIRGVAWNF